MNSKVRTTIVLWSIGVLLALSAAGSSSVMILADDTGSAAAGLAPDECLFHGVITKRADVPEGQQCDQPAPEGDSEPAPPPADPAPPADTPEEPAAPAPDAGASPPPADPAAPDAGAAAPEAPQTPADPTASNTTTDTTTAPATDASAPADTTVTSDPSTPAAPSAPDTASEPAEPADTPASPDLPQVPDFDRRTKSTAEDEEAAQVDARTFRAQFNPAGRIPDLPELSTKGAKVFSATAKRYGTSWSMLAAVAWLDGRWEGTSTSGASVRAAAKTLASNAKPGHPYAGLSVYFNGNAKKVKRARYLADYYDAVGLLALRDGLNDEDAQKYLARRAIADDRIDIYGGGLDDIEDGVVDPRVLVTLEFLANRYDSVKVCSLITGHSVFTKSGNISNHSKGQAADICGLGGVSIYGHQQSDGITVKAVKDLLQMPVQMDTEEIITLWAFGLPSFALADHDDHIHVGFEDPNA